MSYAINYYDDIGNLTYSLNLSDSTTSPKLSYVYSNSTCTAYVEEIPMKLVSLGYKENKDNFEFPWEREDYSLKVSMRANGVDVTVKRGDKTTSFFHKYSTDMSEFRRLLLESEIKLLS